MIRYDDVPYWKRTNEKSASEQTLRSLGFTTQTYFGYEYIIIGSLEAPKILIISGVVTPGVLKVLDYILIANMKKVEESNVDKTVKEVLNNYTLVILTHAPSYLLTPHKFESHVSNDMGNLFATLNTANGTFEVDDINGRLEKPIYLESSEFFTFFKNIHDNDTS